MVPDILEQMTSKLSNTINHTNFESKRESKRNRIVIPKANKDSIETSHNMDDIPFLFNFTILYIPSFI